MSDFFRGLGGGRAALAAGLLSAVSALAAGCAGTTAATSHSAVSLGDAAAKVDSAPDKATPRELSLAGFQAWLTEGNLTSATSLWDRALERDAGEVLALFGRLDAARRSLDSAAREDAAFRICESAPGHALCSLNLFEAFRRSGDSPEIDAAIERRARALLERSAAETVPERRLSPTAALQVRRALYLMAQSRLDFPAAHQLASDGGFLEAAWLLGPFSRYAFLDTETAFWPESADADLASGGDGLWGKVSLRRERARQGMLEIYGDPAEGHVYYWAADLSFAEDADYRIDAMGAPAAVFLDSVRVVDRPAHEAFFPAMTASEVHIPAGRHRLLIKVPRVGASAEKLGVFLTRTDSRPTAMSVLPPEGVLNVSDASRASLIGPVSTDAASMAASLEAEFGSVLAAYLAASGGHYDGAGEARLAESLCRSDCSVPLLSLRAATRSLDPTLPKSVSAGRSVGDWEEVVAKDAFHAAALYGLISHSMREGRRDRVESLMSQLKKSLPDNSPALWAVSLNTARVSRAETKVTAAAEGLLRAVPQSCQALDVLYDLARKDDAQAKMTELLSRMDGCPANHARRAQYHRNRGEVTEAIRELERDEDLPSLASVLDVFTSLSVAARDFDGASRRLRAAIEEWPYSSSLYRRLADVLRRAGDKDGALEALSKALFLSRGDLELYQAVAMMKSETVLPGAVEDGLAWTRRYLEAAPEEDASVTLVLDSYVSQVLPNGTELSLTQTIFRANDQEGARRIAEVNIPGGAQIVVLRTIKEDGRVIESEPISGKNSISMQGVEAGDFVEAAYLQLSSGDMAISPGFMTPRFSFRGVHTRFFHSVFEVRLPADMQGIVIDTHEIPASAMTDVTDGGLRTIRVAFDDVPPLIPEPKSVPVAELIPWIQIGHENATESAYLLMIGDAWKRFGLRTAQMDELAQELAGSLTGRAAVEAIYNGVMKRIPGDEKNVSAAVTLAENRGSRLNLTKALLEARGFKTHLIAARKNSDSPMKPQLPVMELWNTILLAVELPESEGGEVILCPAYPWAPFGKIPPQLAGARAARLPEKGEGGPKALQFFSLPDDGDAGGSDIVSLSLELDGTGALRGEGESRATGWQAATIRRAIAHMSRERIGQMVEQAIVGNNFKGARLLSFDVSMESERPGDLSFHYRFEVPHFARVSEDGGLVLDRGLVPQDLAQDWLPLFARETPMEISEPGHSIAKITLTLPDGFALSAVPDPVQISNEFGTYARTLSVSGRTVELSVDFQLRRGRISPEAYGAFGGMLTSIDRTESAPWHLVKK